MRDKMQIPRGERYELCRSVHAEANAIISAPRSNMIGATLYLVGIECSNGEITPNANSCAMCKRMIINAGISTVIIREDKENYKVVNVMDEWVIHDETLEFALGY